MSNKSVVIMIITFILNAFAVAALMVVTFSIDPNPLAELGYVLSGFGLLCWLWLIARVFFTEFGDGDDAE